jgi:thiol-disulfide isomerase/thioredoxin
MKNNFYLLLTIIILSSTAYSNESLQKREVQQEPHVKKVHTPSTKIYSFAFENLHNQVSTITMQNDIYSFPNIKQPIVMISLFSTWCPPCRGEIPHLANLQKKFKEHFFIIGALVYDDISKNEFAKFMIAQKALFFISTNQVENLRFAKMITPKLKLKKDFPMPLMILFYKGKYFTHYEGSMPEEMIQSDIEQLLEKIK